MSFAQTCFRPISPWRDDERNKSKGKKGTQPKVIITVKVVERRNNRRRAFADKNAVEVAF
jgi:hypothetical protein